VGVHGLQCPTNGILREYNEIKDSLITHRPEDGHKDWCAVTLYGLVLIKQIVIGNIERKD